MALIVLSITAALVGFVLGILFIATVFEARDMAHHRDRALPVLPRSSKEEEAIEDFYNEARRFSQAGRLPELVARMAALRAALAEDEQA